MNILLIYFLELKQIKKTQKLIFKQNDENFKLNNELSLFLNNPQKLCLRKIIK
jgi:hypothetical protein